MNEFAIDDTKPVVANGDVKAATLKSGMVSVTLGATTYIGPSATMDLNIKAACALEKRDEAAVTTLTKSVGASKVVAENVDIK